MYQCVQMTGIVGNSVPVNGIVGDSVYSIMGNSVCANDLALWIIKVYASDWHCG